MGPIQTMDNAINRILRNAKHFRQCVLRVSLFMQAANLSDLFVVKFGLSIFNAVMVAPTSFRNHVDMIVTFSSEKQVVRANARRVIAFMQNAQACCKFAVVKSIRKNVGFHTSRAVLETTVSKRVMSTDPKPTGSGFLNIRPKSFFGRAGEMLFQDNRGVAVFSPTFVMCGAKAARF